MDMDYPNVGFWKISNFAMTVMCGVNVIRFAAEFRLQCPVVTLLSDRMTGPTHLLRQNAIKNAKPEGFARLFVVYCRG